MGIYLGSQSTQITLPTNASNQKSIKIFLLIFLLLIRVKGSLPNNKSKCMRRKSLKPGNLPKNNAM